MIDDELRNWLELEPGATVVVKTVETPPSRVAWGDAASDRNETWLNGLSGSTRWDELVAMEAFGGQVQAYRANDDPFLLLVEQVVVRRKAGRVVEPEPGVLVVDLKDPEARVAFDTGPLRVALVSDGGNACFGVHSAEANQAPSVASSQDETLRIALENDPQVSVPPIERFVGEVAVAPWLTNLVDRLTARGLGGATIAGAIVRLSGPAMDLESKRAMLLDGDSPGIRGSAWVSRLTHKTLELEMMWADSAIDELYRELDALPDTISLGEEVAAGVLADMMDVREALAGLSWSLEARALDEESRTRQTLSSALQELDRVAGHHRSEFMDISLSEEQLNMYRAISDAEVLPWWS